MTGNPLIFRERRSAAGSSTFYVDAALLLLFGPDSGSYGSKMGAAAATSRYAHSTTASTLPLIYGALAAVPDAHGAARCFL